MVAILGAFTVIYTVHFFSGRRVASMASDKTWTFAVSGDSRNCGDLIMPAIAASAKVHDASFYWHLGDFRAAYMIDQDMAAEPEHAGASLKLADYQEIAWQDFIDRQLVPFTSMPVYLAMGNHELMEHTRADYVHAFRRWLDAPAIQNARVKDGGSDVATYYHWTQGGVDFLTLDNASHDQFDAAQMDWFRKLMARDEADPSITTIVLGMHAALPDSISFGHSMSESKSGPGIASGREVYGELLKAQNESHKKIYLLASHSHIFMEGVFNTDYWNGHGGVLPGWIVGTAGAAWIDLPPGSNRAAKAMQRVYGYLLATVNPDGLNDGSIRFDFQLFNKGDVPSDVAQRYGSEVVDYCFERNLQTYSH